MRAPQEEGRTIFASFGHHTPRPVRRLGTWEVPCREAAWWYRIGRTVTTSRKQMACSCLMSEESLALDARLHGNTEVQFVQYSIVMFVSTSHVSVNTWQTIMFSLAFRSSCQVLMCGQYSGEWRGAESRRSQSRLPTRYRTRPCSLPIDVHPAIRIIESACGIVEPL